LKDLEEAASMSSYTMIILIQAMHIVLF